MDLYTLLRAFADSWGLLALVIIFLGVIVWAFRPGSAELHRDIAQIPLRNDGKPLRDENDEKAVPTSTGTKPTEAA